jgi:hypothetical protein
MRTEQVHIAMREAANRYEVCQLTSKGVHRIHKSGERMQDCINRVLGTLRRTVPPARPIVTL